MGNYYETFSPPFAPNFDPPHGTLAINSKAFDRCDEEVCDDVHDRLSCLYGIDTQSVEVSCRHNVVTLSGTVDSDRVATFLAAVASHVLGVREVVNNLELKRSGATAAANSHEIEVGG